jgi:hypothetical protein
VAESLVLIGAFCVIAAIVGGGLEFAQVGKVPYIDSLLRQAILAVCGAAAIWGGLALRADDGAAEPSPSPGPDLPALRPDPGPDEGEEPFLKRRPRTVQPGTLMTLSGGGFKPGERVVIKFATTELGGATANTSGRFNGKRVRFPRDWAFAGQSSIRATGEQSVVTVERPIEVRCKTGYRQRLSSCLAPGTPGYSGP